MEPLLPVVSLAVVVSAALTIAGHYLRPPHPPLIYIFKPLTTILILAVAFVHGSLGHESYARATALGLLFSLFAVICEPAEPGHTRLRRLRPVQSLYPKPVAADALLLATPVYRFTFSAQCGLQARRNDRLQRPKHRQYVRKGCVTNQLGPPR